MAQANYTPISLYYTSNVAAVPAAGNLTSGELAINIVTGTLYFKDSNSTVQILASKTAANGVASINFGSTGLTPNTASNGTVTVSGILATTNGGTGVTTSTGTGAVVLSNTPTLNTVIINGGTSNGLTSTNVTISSGSANGVTVSNSTLISSQINAYTEGVIVVGNTSNAVTINIANATIVTATLTANCTFTMPGNTAGKSFILLLKTGNGSFTSSFTSVKWVGNTAPTITTANNSMDILTFIADGANWYGNYAQGYKP